MYVLANYIINQTEQNDNFYLIYYISSTLLE